MDWRLGLDLGTNSIGWSALRLGETGPEELLDMGVRIFSDGREPGKNGRIGEPKAVARRLARGARKLRERRVRRIRSMVAELLKSKYISSENLMHGSDFKTLNPYQLRAKAVFEPLSEHELARVLIQLAKRRGFKSNRKEQNEAGDKAGEDTEYKQKIKNFENFLGERTLGQYLWEQFQKKETLRFKKETTEYYPSRQLYESEFQKILSVQKDHHSNLDWNKIQRIIFFQRPLKPVDRGNCRFYREEKRAYKNQPSSHSVRIAQELLNLYRLTSRGEKLPLTPAQFQQLFSALHKKKSMTFGGIRKELGIHDSFNLETETRKELKGNTIHILMMEKLGEYWEKLDLQVQDKILEILIEADDDSVVGLLIAVGLDKDKALKIASVSPQNGTTQISAKFQRDCLAIMLKDLTPYFEAVKRLGYHHSDVHNPEPRAKLPYYGEVLVDYVMGARPDQTTGDMDANRFGKINNPTVHIALNQLRKLVNRLIERFGKPAEICLELARELKLSPKSIDDLLRKQKENQDVREAGKKTYTEIGYVGAVSDNDLKKFKLWKELERGGNNHQCLYCGKVISASQLVSSEVEIEHILPYSRTLDNSLANLTLAHKHCNQKKGNRTPFEAFAHEQGDYLWDNIYARAKLVGKERKFHPDAMKDLEANETFLDRQLTDNAYISRVTKMYLSCITAPNKIWATPGRLTANLRAEWGINTLLNKGGQGDTWFKNRTDHRHHALDAVVIGLTDRGLLKKVATLNSRGQNFRVQIPECPLPRHIIGERLKEILVSHKPDHGYEGKLFKETAMGKIKTLKKLILNNPDDLEDLTEEDLNKIRPLTIRQKILTEAEKSKISSGKRWFSAFKQRLSEKYTHLIVPRIRWVARAGITNWSSWKEISQRWADPKQVKDLEAFLKEQTGGKNLEDLSLKDLQKLLAQYSAKTNIRNIRYFPKDEPRKGTEIKSAPFKRYTTEDFFCVDIWAIPTKGKTTKYEGVFVTRLEAYKNPLLRQKANLELKPHPAARNVMRLFKNDTLLIKSENEVVFAQIGGFSTTTNSIDLQSIFNSDELGKWNNSTSADLRSKFWEGKKGQNFKSINAIFSNGQPKIVITTEDGRWINR